ncbi:3-ketoacyl-ACP reductase [Actinomadura sp. NBRC 104425]|uniref:SDR family oxidoreductase n=1 Tax=Actinomadura sp. NBRC 104425 TaxID=3032204 RepID=UPI0024A41739|nr:SDR family oxidoreductase [Actinomadura sp. NBRC 104425]GLZ14923.1 3-ketoacyl-ACP reductase [Actinomadura sp. NBRC 104425]
MRITDCRAIVTGAASGLGREFCAGLTGAGATVVAVDKDERGLARLAADLGEAPGDLHTYRLDVTREDEVTAVVAKAFGEWGPIDVLVNSAGIYRDGLLVNSYGGRYAGMPLAQWRTVVDADLTGTFLMSREVCLRMVEQRVRPGVIINISSISRAGNAGQGNYAAAKAGVVAFTRTMALELAPYGIRAAAIAPGFIDTPILAAMDPAKLGEWVDTVPLRRLGTPQEIFAGVRFIIECDYFTGRCLEIDGGLAI